MSDIRRAEQHAAGQRAALVLELAEPRLVQRERELLDEACQACRSQKLDAQGALLYVTRLTELQDIRNALRHDVKRGNREMEKLVSAAG